jgi:hypothetical protein
MNPIARRARSRASRPQARTAREGISAGGYALLFAAFLGAALAVYAPALGGPFVSDDHHYVANNVFVHELSFTNVGAILDPTGPAAINVVNYTPVHLLLHAVAWRAFGHDVEGHHVVNVVLHALSSVLLVALLLGSRLPRFAAFFGGAFFLLHPANVEAVAWISQLKSSSALALSLAALLAHPRRPALASVLFLLALLAKPTAACALPVAYLLEWTREGRVRSRWLALWCAIFAAYALAEFATHQRSGAAKTTLYDEPTVLVRTLAAFALRYLVMAATSYGTSAFHEPDPVTSWLDPWWLCSIPVLTLLGWRVVVVLRRRDLELAYWVWALVSFVPISQIFPFLYPLADRYLYFILPGLLGGALLAGREAQARLPALGSRSPESTRRIAGGAGVALGVGAALVFAPRSMDRAAIWSSPLRLMADAAANYPDGVSAHLSRARGAAALRDVDAVVAAIRAAAERGYNRFEQLDADPALAPVRGHPRFRAVVNEIAAGWIESVRDREDPTQMELRMIAHAHSVRGETEAAIRVLRRALAIGGPRDAEIRADLARLGSPAP